ncbi:HAMP domain-containing histidine kinase [Thiospirochaeta perfilievii]|uniref:histidine kinase n=1 Tax=Thiospirochaeta perfilievii TaxID=252967 RepID=A0A5C1QER2_9SPIO|nr:HAMP domain-containing sensor histidine kinase [Thiospirochaeta perfilievii]QEN04712.1 HAMP domain-containing histidine kinase [Thiospirochaeta perfilievii]
MIISIPFLIIITLVLLLGLSSTIIFKQRYRLKTSKEENKALLKSKISALEYIDALWANQQNMILDEKISSLSSLVAGIAHELNTPLGVALTALTYIEDIIENPDAKPMVELTKNNLQKSISLVEKFTEISGGAKVEKLDLFEFKDFIDYASCLVKSPLATKNIRKLELDIHDNLWVKSSEATLSIIVKNILENAFHYAFKDKKDGRVKLSTKVKNTDLTITIEDNGCGMSENQIKHIFEPFYTTRRPERHYGLGLAIAYNLLTRQHNGTLSCDSNPGEGTVIIITIPNVISPAPVTVK